MVSRISSGGTWRMKPEVGAGAAGMKTLTTGRPMASEKAVGCSWVTKAMLQQSLRGYCTSTTRRKVSLLRPLRASTIWRMELYSAPRPGVFSSILAKTWCIILPKSRLER